MPNVTVNTTELRMESGICRLTSIDQSCIDNLTGLSSTREVARGFSLSKARDDEYDRDDDYLCNDEVYKHEHRKNER